MRHRIVSRSKIPTALLILFSCALAGCSTPIFAGMTLGEVSVFGSLFSTAATGKGLGDYAMDAATGRDCRIVEGLVREDRKVCERKNSPALAEDWHGLASLDGGTPQPPYTGRPEMPPRDGSGG